MKKADPASMMADLRKIPANKRCFDCQQGGTTYVICDLGIFLCSICAGLHREFSHRVKGLSTCNFSQKEVDSLKAVGNELAAKTWLARHNPKENPIPDNKDPRRLREFIRAKYVDKRFYREEAVEETKTEPKPQSKAEVKPQSTPAQLIDLMGGQPSDWANFQAPPPAANRPTDNTRNPANPGNSNAFAAPHIAPTPNLPNTNSPNLISNAAPVPPNNATPNMFPPNVAPTNMFPANTAPPNAFPPNAAPNAVPTNMFPANTAPPNAFPPNAAPPNAAPTNMFPANTAPPSAFPPNAAPPNSAPTNMFPANTAPPSAFPPNAAPPNAAPTNMFPGNTAPTNMFPANTAPPNAFPANTAPPNAAPTNMFPGNTAPTNMFPANTAPPSAFPANTAPTNMFPANAAPTNAPNTMNPTLNPFDAPTIMNANSVSNVPPGNNPNTTMNAPGNFPGMTMPSNTASTNPVNSGPSFHPAFAPIIGTTMKVHSNLAPEPAPVPEVAKPNPALQSLDPFEKMIEQNLTALTFEASESQQYMQQAEQHQSAYGTSYPYSFNQWQQMSSQPQRIESKNPFDLFS